MPVQSLHLLYHELRAAPSRYSYVTAVSSFAEHCRLYRHLQEALPDTKLLRPELTFDDGHASDFTFARPLLAQHDLTATFFITAGWTGKRAGYMDWPQLRELHAAGHRIGAHGMEHRLLTGCSPRDLDREIRGARQCLEDGLSAPVLAMSLPGGRANRRVLDACFAADFTQVFTSKPEAQNMANRPRTVGRLNLLGGTTVDWLERVLDPSTGLLQRLARTARLKAACQDLLGDSLYAKLWALLNHEPAASAAESPS